MLPGLAGIAGFTSSATSSAPSATNWRINITANGGTGNYSIAELEMRSSAGGADQCTGGTASASSTLSTNVASNAFANDGTTTYWVSSNTVGSQWLEYDFASPQTIVEIAMTSRSDLSSTKTAIMLDTPQAFDVQYYNGSTWVTYWSVTTGPFGVGETRVINMTDASPDKKFWRVRITATQAGSQPSMEKLELRTVSGGSNVATGGTPIASTILDTPYVASNCFDGNSSTFWVSANFAAAQWIGYELTSSQEIVEIVVRNRPDGFGVNESLKDFSIQYWSGGTWTDAWSYTGQAAWSAGETRTFTKP